MQGVDLLDAVEYTLLEQRLGAAGLDLLGGLEDEAHPHGQLSLLVQPGEHEPRAEDRGGVDVVAAGVGHARAAGAEGQPGGLRHR